jgi:hypothetical protein
MFFLVSGAAAAGKSTVARRIPTLLDNVECHDSDEKPAHDEYLRCATLEEWIALALEAQRQECDFLLAAQSPLGELLACPSAPELDGISACLLDCSDTARIARIRARGIDPRWPPSQHTLNWAAWQRVHAWDPQWEPHVINGNGPDTHRYERWLNWAQDDERWRVEVLDTTEASIEQALEMIAEWVKFERARASLLSPKTKWWI